MRNLIVAILALAGGALAQDQTVRAYVSLDREHSSKILARFERETGIRVDAQYDTEATKTIGMVRRLITEKSKPQCDVYWNNELATMVKLKESGVLQAYRSPMATDIPAAFKDADGFWTAFAARARVLIVNTDLVGPDEMPTSMWDLCDAKWKGKICMARPETGTTAAHASALYTLDEAKADEYFDKLIANDCVWLTGNAHCMREVAAGRFAFGWTDTDDFNVALIQRKPVAMVYPDAAADAIGVMFIPNSLGLIKGAPHAEAGKKLIDWLLRAETEAMLAKAATAQIPVRPGVPVPDNVQRFDQIGKAMPLDWSRVGKEYDKWVDHVRAKREGAEETSPTLMIIVGAVVLAVIAVVVLLRRATGEPT